MLGMSRRSLKKCVDEARVVQAIQAAERASSGEIRVSVATYFWGDVHRKNLGETRAAFISPMAAAMDAGLKATNHTDFNVTPLNPFFVLWTSMARTTRSGHVLGLDQRIDAYRGLIMQIRLAFEIGAANRRRGLKPMSGIALLRCYIAERRLISTYL